MIFKQKIAQLFTFLPLTPPRLPISLSPLRSRHRRAGSQGTEMRHGGTGHRLSFSWGQGAAGAADTSFNSAGAGRGLAAVFVSATVDIVPPSSLLPTPSMQLARKYSLDCRCCTSF